MRGPPLSVEKVGDNVPDEECADAAENLPQKQRIASLLLIERPCNSQECIDLSVVVVATLQLVALFFKVGQSMPRAVNDSKQLWERKDEVDYLRHEKKQHSLAKVTQDAHNGKGHASEVAICVTNKHLGRECIVLHQSEGRH